jgi:DNA ligase 1
MPDLKESESVEMQGSAARPYVLKNLGGVYSCSCPAWRNQSLPIERRSCKHLRRLRGDAAEAARVGEATFVPRHTAKQSVHAPPLLLAETWDGGVDPAGWLLSEKLDGVRAYWDGSRFLSRLGNPFHAPNWFAAGLPDAPQDGELWIGRKRFQRTLAVVRRHDGGDLWREVRFVVFDAPATLGGFEERLEFVRRCLEKQRCPYANCHDHVVCRGVRRLNDELARVFHDAEARVVGREPGAGRCGTAVARAGRFGCRRDAGVRPTRPPGWRPAHERRTAPRGAHACQAVRPTPLRATPDDGQGSTRMGTDRPAL